MAISADTLLETMRLKNTLRRWRMLAIIFVTLFLLALVAKQVDKLPGQDYIARLSFHGMILRDQDLADKISEIAKDDNVKAVIVDIDSPGGTATGGEYFYNSLKELQAKKPVVSVMGNMATSAGYMVAIPADRIFAQKSSLTGSIGVLMQAPNVVGLLEKFGVKMDMVKTGHLKAAPNMFEDFTVEANDVIVGLIGDFYEVFVEMIVESRSLDRQAVINLADGRVYSGRQALKNGLIDEIGSQKHAVKWLEEHKNIPKGLKVIDIKNHERKSSLSQLLGSLSLGDLLPEEMSMQGLLSVWNGAVK